MLADQALCKLLTEYDFETVLDIGCGHGLHLQRFARAGKRTTGIDCQPRCAEAIAADYLQHTFDQPFDCVWTSHVLEHQPNVQQFLRKVFGDLREGGILAITVPPLKQNIVGGHLSLWNTGLLLYNLILAGFDCREARCRQYGYNISVITPKISAALLTADIRFANGDIERLARFFPQHPAMDWRQSFRGDIAELNWDPGTLRLGRRRFANRLLGPRRRAG